jgi:hypothetical protein
MFLLIAESLAAAPAVTPLLAPPDVLEQAKALGPKGDFACEPLWPGDGPWLCFLAPGAKKGTSRWVTRRDLANWKVDFAVLRSRAVADSAGKVQLHAQDVKDSPGRSYWTQDDAWAAAGFLAPEKVAGVVGTTPMFAAVPTSGAALFWPSGDADTDKVMAIGVHEMFEQLDNGVSPLIFQWDGKKWTAYAEAKPSTPK